MNEHPKQTIGLAGLGMMGRGIASCLLGHGFAVRAFSADAKTYDEARREIESNLRELVEGHGFSPSILDDWHERYVEVDSLQRFAECDFVIESVVEDLSIKRSLFSRLEDILRPGVTIASNTSGLSITKLQQSMKDPGRLIGMHWADPSHITRFMELVRGERTSDAAYEAAAALCRSCGKDPSLVRRDVEGFIVNRLGYAMYREALHLLESGVADAATIDEAFRNALGLWAGVAGPFRAMDYFGFKTCVKVMETIFPTLSNMPGPPAGLHQMLDEGAGGMANGRGFYSYTPSESARWKDIFRRHARQITRLQDSHFPRSAPPEKPSP
jgi:3-hydroxybutyryl-CoA dehydrogenase